MQPRCHFRIEWRHHLRQRFDDGYAQPAMPELFRHFQADVAAAHDHGTTAFAILDPCHDALHVRNVAHGEMTRAVNARNRRFEG